MRILGIEFSKDKELSSNDYRKLVFPYGKAQEDKVGDILKTLFPNSSIEDLKYNYIITLEKMKDKNFNSLTNDNLLDITNDLSKAYLSKNNDVSIYLALVEINKTIDENLNYPTIEEIKQKSIKIKELL